MSVRPKKFLGQHFLKDENLAQRIVDALNLEGGLPVVEIGPGMGVLTKYLVQKKVSLILIELDRESVEYLEQNWDPGDFKVLNEDFLKTDVLNELEDYKIIGNFPYNISSQIFFKVFEQRNKVSEVVCMLQKEVAQRIASPPGNKTYGILSVLMQAFYDIEYLFTVKPGAFHPPPKVDSGVIRLTRNSTHQLACNEKLFVRVVKQGFQNRRKTLRNALKPINLPAPILDLEVLNKRAEQLGVEDYVQLVNSIESNWKT